MTLAVVALRVRTSEAPAARTYVGQESCMSSGCHATAYSATSDYQGADAFRQTLHQKIHFRPNPETVVIEKYFAGDSTLRVTLASLPVPGSDTLIINLSKSDDGRDYFAQMRFSNNGDTTTRMKIAYTYGGHGWIQRFLVEVNGSLYVLPFQYVLPAYKERSDTSNAFYYLDLNRWFAQDPSTGLGQFFRFNTNRFRAQAWDKECSFCHVNGFGLAKRISGGDTSFVADWAGRGEDSIMQDRNILIGCESCHGPGSDHVTAPSKSNIFSPGSLAGTREATDVKLDLCNACHTRVRSTAGTYKFPYDEATETQWLPGERITSFYRHPFNDAGLWPDRVTANAHHQSGQDYWRSKPYAAHVFTNGCWDCHSVHANGRNGLPYQLKKNYYSTQDGVGCLECHGSNGSLRTPPLEDMSQMGLRNGRTVNTHTQHEAKSSACVNCHFTKTATISFVELPRKPYFEFSQHDFRVIRPSATLEYANTPTIGMMNTCAASCHRNGRGGRNNADSMPAAPAFGILDRNVVVWTEDTDVALADSLWRHYQTMFGLSTSERQGDAGALGASIISVAPNPSSSNVSVRFSIPRRVSISLDVFDARGRLVRTLSRGSYDAGLYIERWKGVDETGAPVQSGTYYVRMRAGIATSTSVVEIIR